MHSRFPFNGGKADQHRVISVSICEVCGFEWPCPAEVDLREAAAAGRAAAERACDPALGTKQTKEK